MKATGIMILLPSHSPHNGGSPVRTTGRLDSYGAVRKPPPDDFPPELSSVFSGVSWTNVRKIITFVEKSPEISFSAAFHYIPHT